MNSGLKSGLVLLVLGIICGTLLAVVNSLTAETIANNELIEKNAVLEEFYNLNNYDLEEKTFESDEVSTIYVLKEKGTDNINAIIYQVAATGYNGPITMLIAVNSDYSIEGYTVLTHSEDPGFGADIVEKDFLIESVTDLDPFDSVAGVTYTSNGILGCFEIVAARAGQDFGGGLDD
ncbi:MAG: FMN-binding protein [Tenericutes bacterium]|nr:FMN-binding protein [Mycoplasmatota bacterium]